MKENNNDKLLVGLLVVAVVVAIAGTWFNLQTVSDSIFISGASIGGGSSLDSTVTTLTITNIGTSDGLIPITGVTTTETMDCSLDSGAHLATGETIECGKNATPDDVVLVNFGGNYKVSVNGTVISGYTNTSTLEMGYCSVAPVSGNWVNSANSAWAINVAAGATVEKQLIANLTAGVLYNLTCEHASGIKITEEPGAKVHTFGTHIFPS